MGGACSTYWERRGMYRVLVGKPEGKRPVGRPRPRWEDKIKMEKIEKNEMGGACSTYGEGEVCTGFWWGNLRERDQLEDLGLDGRIILRWIFRNLDMGTRTGLIWLRKGAGGGLVNLRIPYNSGNFLTS